MNFNIGYNFDRSLPRILGELNKQYEDTGNRIASVYGSDRDHAHFSARPAFRIQEIGKLELSTHVKQLAGQGIDFNYTFNSPNLGSKREFMDKRGEISDWLYDLELMGVKRIIVADTMLLDFIAREMPNLNMNIEISTIMHIDTPMQIMAFKELDPRIDRVVGNILYNRSFDKLKTFARVAKRVGIDYEVMTNEFCSTISTNPDSANMAHCIYRDSCYDCHATNVTKSDAAQMHGYPMGNCMSGRAQNPADWLRSNFILPQHLKHYAKRGIEHFKITGRTAKTPYLIEMVKAHLSERYEGNLMRLWKPLETISSEKDEVSEHKYKFDIPVTPIMDRFLDPWDLGLIDCTEQVCDECHYCDNFYQDWVKPLK